MPASPTDSAPIDHGRIEDVDVSTEMQGSFLEYAYSVIYSRALPDARDGLKPVQRRILYQMADMGLRPDRGHVKSARVVGEVMGKLHPHGDAPIYDALVRLAQPFSLRVPLVDGHGNFGSLDDGPAAPRYTEARLAAPALALTENLDEDVVDFIPNYDGQFQQPEVLPAAYPNLLVNGATGIAVGMATNMAPHNLIEVVGAAVHLLDNPEATVEELMEFVPGPDLPSGGIIVGLDGIKDAYAKGRGSFRTRAKVSIESLGPRRTGIVVTELPYLVGPERIIEKIKDAVTAKKLQGIADVTDLTDRHNGLRLVIGIKTGFDPQAVLEHLYRLTPLEDSFSINNVALVDGQPQTLGLRDLLRVYLDHRMSVVTRRSRYRLARRKERLHLVEGLLIAILDIDEVIQVIRTSDDGEQARTRLMDVFDLSEPQAEYILELRLRRLTRFSRIELEAERDKLKTEIAELEELLASEILLRAQVARELDAAAETYGTPRRTLLLNGGPVTPRSRAAAAAADLQIADAPCRVFLSATGRMVRAEVASDAPNGGIVPRHAAPSTTPSARGWTRPPVATSAPSPARAGSSGSRRSTCPRCPATQCSWPRGRAPTSTSDSRPASTSSRSFRSTTAAHRPRHPPRHREARRGDRAREQARHRDRRAARRRPGRRRRTGDRRRRARLRRRRRAAAAVRRLVGASARARGRRHGGHPAERRRRGHRVQRRGCLGVRCRRGHRRRVESGAGRHGRGQRQGLGLQRVPREGARDRWSARSAPAQGRGRAHARVGRLRAARGGAGRRDPHTAGDGREAGCLGHAARRRHRRRRHRHPLISPTSAVGGVSGFGSLRSLDLDPTRINARCARIDPSRVKRRCAPVRGGRSSR
nr:hypothetical protein GCM10025699_26210 [Microbacterium flavescens]